MSCAAASELWQRAVHMRPARRRRFASFALALSSLAIAGCGASASRSTPTKTAAAAAATATATATSGTSTGATSGAAPARRKLATRVDPGRLPQTRALPSAKTTRFGARAAALWRGIITDSVAAAMPAFFPRAAYLQVKQIANPGADYSSRLVAAYRADIRAAHSLLGAGAARARLLSVSVPSEWAWIPPGSCSNGVGYWHAPGSRLAYREAGRVRSFGIFSLISWRGEWYVVHLASYDQPGTVDNPAVGVGTYGPTGGC